MSLNCRCISVGKDEEDYRPLFENFLQDLLVTLNRPDWPAAEVLLTLLGRLLVSKLLWWISLKMKWWRWILLDKTFSDFCRESRIQWSFTVLVGSSLSVLGGEGEGTPFLLLLFYFRLWDCCQSTAPLISWVSAPYLFSRNPNPFSYPPNVTKILDLLPSCTILSYADCDLQQQGKWC